MADPEAWLRPSTMAAWRALLETHVRIMPLIDEQLDRDGDLTHSQYGVLLALQSEPQGLTMGEIARTMIVSKSGLTYQVSQLVEAGRVTRAVDPDDSRRRVVRITRDGLDALDDVREGHLAILREHFEAPLSPEGMGALADGLTTLNAHLREDGA